MKIRGEWSTRAVPPARRAGDWSRFLAGEGQDCPFASLGGPEFEGRLALTPLLDGQIAWIVGGPLALREAPADGARMLYLYAVVDGSIERLGDGPPLRAGIGEVLICRSHASAELRASDQVRLAAAVFPERLVMNRIARKGALKPQASHRTYSLATRLVFDLVSGLAADAEVPPRPGSTLEALTAATVMMLEDVGAAPQEAPTQAAARLAALREHLRLHYPDPGLSPAKTAEALAISVRYLHKLMNQAGRSFREELTMLRLEVCKAALADPFRANETIAEIAFSAGFNDLSQFNRHFRTAYGSTPSAARTGAVGPAATLKGGAAQPASKTLPNGRGRLGEPLQ
jgi:AraC-like DNA-binding protein